MVTFLFLFGWEVRVPWIPGTWGRFGEGVCYLRIWCQRGRKLSVLYHTHHPPHALSTKHFPPAACTFAARDKAFASTFFFSAWPVCRDDLFGVLFWLRSENIFVPLWSPLRLWRRLIMINIRAEKNYWVCKIVLVFPVLWYTLAGIATIETFAISEAVLLPSQRCLAVLS